ncbi:hypothetical protein M2272_002887 [Mycobacterium frederiksbergense]|uniref:Transferase n=1 Tax=Mycolicibacterium frederiksbergense TaxID=117567 RepID=A0ABT6KZX3_9MYCO|nr:methyltransferase domain-containing protein [Mycolicibacterium frederiksbergense]MDH6196244.1 hypothetical protein [Mycolicibacterium frederiksbergense]
MSVPPCRSCAGRSGSIVLDLGDQPACDHFPPADDPGPDPVYRLQMWLCEQCGLAQLVDDPTNPEEPRGVEPTALVKQSMDAVERVAAAGWLQPGTKVAEYGSPHGGSWLQLITDRGLETARDDELADVVIDCFGLMHWRDQAAAIAERAKRVADNGVLLIQYHELCAVVRQGQWNMLRLGHYAYYSMTTLVEMLKSVGFRPRTAWPFDLYGGTVLLAATRDGATDPTVSEILRNEAEAGIGQPACVGQLAASATSSVGGLKDWLVSQKADGRTVLGYGAASRAVAMLAMANINSAELPGIADASSAKWARRMPGTDIPIISPAELVSARPDHVLLLLPDLSDEVRAQLPEIEENGGEWVNIESITSVP